ncbi:MAG: hypothetical protein OEN52_07150 [Gammaproteobacteria bacterium]|nr:hypothetical protein [Gammaproteobacteria bacterium]
MNTCLKIGASAALGILVLVPPVSAGPLQDPTRPTRAALFLSTSAPRPSADKWTLDSTLVATDRRVAVINGTHVSEGESIDGARVLKIRNTDVLIQAPGRQISLQLIPDTLKMRP